MICQKQAIDDSNSYLGSLALTRLDELLRSVLDRDVLSSCVAKVDGKEYNRKCSEDVTLFLLYH